jgi:glycosyltransferase involved in cell wall biosynthesis
MNMGRPPIAVIIPACNASARIEGTIQSVLEQSRLADEIVVVDDGSTDGTADVAARFSPRATLVRQKNAGQGRARQRGVEATTAELLLFLDADDLLYPAALEKLSAALDRDARAALAYCLAELWPAAGDFPPRVDTLAQPAGGDCWSALMRGNFIRTPGCALIRRAALEEAGGWDADIKLRGNEDWELWLRLAEKGPFVLAPEPLIKYRMDGAGFSSDRRRMYRSMFRMLGKQRLRWKHSRSRLRAVGEGEWRFCKNVLCEIRSEARSACSKGQWLPAAGHLGEAFCIGTRPIMSHVLHFGPRRLVHGLRVICGRQENSPTA